MKKVSVFWILSICALAALSFFLLSQSQPALAVLSPQAGNISGICRYYGNLGGSYTIDVCAHTDLNTSPVDCDQIISPGGEYSITGLENGTYYISALMSIDNSGGPPKTGDPVGMYDPDSDGDYETVTVNNNEVKNVNLSLDFSQDQGKLIIYVKRDASGANNGSNWKDAYTQLPTALSSADSALAGVEIWMTDGTYKPTTGSTRTDTFQLKNNVEIYGGFAGTEILREQRILTRHTTILSGQIGGSGDEDNSLHVVDGSGTNTTAILADVTIMGGYAKPSPPLVPTANEDRGGGMLIVNGSPRVANVRFVHNYANLYGGGMYVDGSSSSVYIINSLFNSNIAGSMGGGLNVNNGGHVRVINGTFVYNASNPSLAFGGGIHSWGSSSETYAQNTILAYNTPQNLYSTLSVDQLEVNYGLVEGGCASGYECNNTLSAAPEFVDPDGPDGVSGNLDDDFHLLSNSPAIDAGSNGIIVTDMADLDGDGNVTEQTPCDFDGWARRINFILKADSGSGSAPIVDMGAFETPNYLFLPAIRK